MFGNKLLVYFLVIITMARDTREEIEGCSALTEKTVCKYCVETSTGTRSCITLLENCPTTEGHEITVQHKDHILTYYMCGMIEALTYCWAPRSVIIDKDEVLCRCDGYYFSDGYVRCYQINK